jgi:hypothetical protein
MAGERVAGHQFVNTPAGEACECGKTWLYVLDRREEWKPGAPGIAHIGGLEEKEVAELNAKLQRIWDAGMRF